MRRIVVILWALAIAASCSDGAGRQTGTTLDAAPETTLGTVPVTVPVAPDQPTSTTAPVVVDSSPATTTTEVPEAPGESSARPWHAPQAAHADPAAAVAEFIEFIGFGNDITVSEFRSGDSRSGEIEIDPAPPGESQFDRSTTVFVRLDAADNWFVAGAVSDAVVVDLPPPDATVAPPLDLRVTHDLPSAGVMLQLWPDGAPAPLVDQQVTQGGGVFAMDVWDITIDWPVTTVGPATAIFTSYNVAGTIDSDDAPTTVVAVTTLRLELAADAAPTSGPSPATVIGPIGDQRIDVLYQAGVRLSIFEPSPCATALRPTIVTGGPSSQTFVEEFRARGYLVVDVAWRTPGYTGGLTDGTLRAFSFSVNDLGVAVQWLRAHADELCVDTDQIAAVGHSFGAITGLSLAYSQGELASPGELTIDELGGSAALPLDPPIPPPELASYSNEVGAVVAFAGFAIGQTVDAGEPPALLFHGSDDRTIPIALAEQTCAAATAVGVTCELVRHDEGHGLPSDRRAVFDRADEFLRRQLGIDAAAG